MIRKTVKIMLTAILLMLVLAVPIFSGCSQAPTTVTVTPTNASQSPIQTTVTVTATTTKAAETQPTTSASVSVADFFKTHTVTMKLGTGAGGGTDFAARVFASYWPEVTGGGSMIVKNVTGAGGMAALNEIYTAKPDGLTLGGAILAADFIIPTFAKAPGMQFDINKINWIGSLVQEVRGFVVSAKSPYKTMKDLQAISGLKLGNSGATGAGAVAGALLIDFFKLKDARIVTGYNDTSELVLGVVRGEVVGFAQETSVLKVNKDKGFTGDPLVIMDSARTSVFPDVLAVTEQVDLTAEQKTMLAILSALAGSKVFFAPPSMPADKLQFIRDAFDKMVVLPAFQKNMGLTFPLWTPPVQGKDIDAKVKAVMSMPAADIERLMNIADKYIIR